MFELTIEKKAKTKRGKSKIFSGALLAHMTADVLWDVGGSDSVRPIYLVLAGSEPALRPLVANLQSGKRAYQRRMGGGYMSGARTWFEIMKSARYTYSWQRGDVATVTIYQHDLFVADPGMIDPEQCQFIVTTPQWWQEQDYARLLANQELVERVLGHASQLELGDVENVLGTPAFSPDRILRMVPEAVRFAHYLDKRTRRPLLNDMAFCLQLYLAALTSGLASFSHVTGKKWGHTADWVQGFVESGMEELGFLPSVVMCVEQEEVDSFLADQVRLYRAVGEVD